MARDAPKQDSIDANVPMTTSGTPTEWEQRRRLVQAIMDSLGQLMEQMDHTAAPGCYSLRRILVETGVTLDMIRARVAHQAFAGGPPEAFWPPMRALLDSFFPELGSLVCESLEMERAYEAFWEPETRALMHEMSNATPEPESFLNVVTQFLSAGRQVEAEGDQVVFTPSSGPLTAAQCHFLDCAEALSRTLAQVFEEAVARGDVPTGPCWVCGADAMSRCDYQPPGQYDAPTCNRWICNDHSVVEAQHWDKRGWDGVDIRCQEHRNLSLDSRDVLRGHGLSPAPRWEGDETGLLLAY